MFFYLSKTIYYFFLPLLWIILFLFFSFFSKKEKRKKNFFLTGIIALLFFSNSFIVNVVLLWWERPPVPLSKLKSYSTAIVLTGIASADKSPRDRVYTDKGADRILHTLQLYKTGKVKKILITGGSGKLTGDSISEAEDFKKIFLLCGIPEADLILETASKNTYENAVFSVKKIKEENLSGPFLLITSAFHMRRSEYCFQKAGLQTESFPVDFYSRDNIFNWESIFPSERALAKWTILFHELLGVLTYKMMGYI